MSRIAATSSGLKTADTQITTMPGLLCGLSVNPPSSGTATITVYDTAGGAVVSGSEIWNAEIASGTDGVFDMFNIPIVVNKGIWVDTDNAEAGYIVYYTLG